MLEQLINLVKENAGDAIVSNPAIPNEHNDNAISTAAGGIFESLKGQLSGGGMDGLMNLLKDGNLSQNPIVSNITQHVGKGLADKFNLDSSAAGSIVSQLIPKVMSQFSSKTNDPNDSSFTVDSILSSFGGSGGGMLDSVKGMFGGK